MEKIEKAILDYFEKFPHIISIILFGSYAKQTTTKESDVDIAILCEPSHIPDPMTLIEWREDLASQLQNNVDLICLNRASPILGMQIYKTGKVLMVRNKRALAEYQMRLFIDYAELKELRAPMEKEILKRKFYDRP